MGAGPRRNMSFMKEEVDQREKIKKMKAEEACPSDLKQQQEILNDTLQVLPDTRDRLKKFESELKSFMEENDLTQEGALQEMVLEANELINQIKAQAPAAMAGE